MSEERQGPGPTETNDSQGAQSDVKPSVRTKKERKPKQLFRVAEPAAPAEPALACKMNTAEIEVQPRQADRQGGWNIGGGAAPEWGPLDLTGGGGNLPPPGNYDAVISDVALIDKSDRLWMIVSFKLVGRDASPAPMFALLASRIGPSDGHNLAEGARVVRRLADATLTALETIEAIKDPFELPRFFVGKSVKLTLVYKSRDGVDELVVRAIMPR